METLVGVGLRLLAIAVAGIGLLAFRRVRRSKQSKNSAARLVGDQGDESSKWAGLLLVGCFVVVAGAIAFLLVLPEWV
jgi:hypothetical protein